jgi:ribosome-binding protein aMBF1 (putative translation factor)
MTNPGPEWIGSLIAAHPSLFREGSLFEFAVGEGWMGILTDLCAALEGLCRTDLMVVQVKEKFGGLRFYIQWDQLSPEDGQEAAGDRVDELIRAAEAKAWDTCESCGAPRETKRMSTLCPACRAHFQREQTAFDQDEADLVDADPYVTASIARDLRAAREQAGLTLDQLAYMVDRPEALVRAVEQGETETSLEYVDAVLRACAIGG